MTGIWTRFRQLPWWLQALGWVVGWPLLAGLWIYVGWGTRKLGKVGAAAVLLFGGLLWYPAFFVDPDTTASERVPPVDQAAATEAASPLPPTEPSTPSPTTTASPTLTPSPAPTPSPSVTEEAPATLAVIDITDGDTLTLNDGAETFAVRLSQVDAPETPDECFSAEAADALRSMAPPGSAVVLRRPGPPFVDNYDRRLGEVVTQAGTSVNGELVRQGFAAWGSKFADEDPDLAGRLRAAEQEAKTAGRGLWAACGGPHVKPEPAPPPPPPADQPPADQGQAANPWGTSSCHAAYDPCVPPPSEVGDLNCPDIRQHYPNGVSVNHAHGDPHGLDRDKDGWGCE